MLGRGRGRFGRGGPVRDFRKRFFELEDEKEITFVAAFIFERKHDLPFLASIAATCVALMKEAQNRPVRAEVERAIRFVVIDAAVEIDREGVVREGKLSEIESRRGLGPHSA